MVDMQEFNIIKHCNILILLYFILVAPCFSQQDKTPFVLGWTGEQAIIEDTLLKDSPNVIMLYEFSCDNNCSALYKLFRKVLSQSKLNVGVDIKVLSLGLGAKDDWQLSRQRALKAFERFPQKAEIEKYLENGQLL